MMTDEQLRRDIAGIVGKSGLLPDDEREQYIINGHEPRVVVFPTQIDQIQELMRWANKTRIPIIPIGNGSKLGIGNPPSRVDVVLSIIKLNHVIEYEPDNLTITVQPGMFLTAFQESLGEKGQFLPLDPPYRDFGTIGGTVASNMSGALRFKYGTARDLVIGIRVVQPDGTLIKGGGKVVKNVAGYDLSKLYVGSYGTLGTIVELTLRLQPLPEDFQFVLAKFASVEDALDTGHQIASSQLVPTVVTAATSLPAAMIEESCLIIAADGHPETVAWQKQRFEDICRSNGALHIESYEGASREALHRTLVTFPEARWMDTAIVSRASVLSTELIPLLTEARQLAQALNLHLEAMSHVGNGVIYFVIGAQDEELQSSAGVSIIKQLRDCVKTHRGFFIVERAPLPIKREVDVWGTIGNSFPLMRKIKDALDPNAILNPGRFVSGI